MPSRAQVELSMDDGHDASAGPPAPDPLAFISMECDRLRRTCRLIDGRLAAEGGNPSQVAELVEGFRADLGRHYRDEQEDLFPLMRLRAHRGDDVTRVMGALEADHTATRDEVTRALAQLDRAPRQGVALDAEAVSAINGFTRQVQAHTALLVAVILPIARLRFTDEDLSALSCGLEARRAG
ncbi:MAG: hemerythrin domain-containing protein [Asticcacaulis sp.]